MAVVRRSPGARTLREAERSVWDRSTRPVSREPMPPVQTLCA